MLLVSIQAAPQDRGHLEVISSRPDQVSVYRTICPLVINSSRLQQYQETTQQPLIGPRHEKKRIFAYAETKAQISCSVSAQLISAFVFATWIVQFLFYLYLKFQAPSLFLKLYMPVSVRPGQKPRRPVFSLRGSINSEIVKTKK